MRSLTNDWPQNASAIEVQAEGKDTAKGSSFDCMKRIVTQHLCPRDPSEYASRVQEAQTVEDSLRASSNVG